MIKEMFIETNPYFLALTMIVSLLHTVFEVLAMKSDIEFWRGRESLLGLSTSLLLYNFFAQIVITLYLLDDEKTSYMILIPCALGVFIDAWKLRKGFDFEF